MTDLVYHFTDTARLPWILLDGALKPGRNRIGEFPDPDFLWATVNEHGDHSASGQGAGYRQGLTLAVRFTLRASDFERWPEATAYYPLWTPEQIARLERAARGTSRPSDWRCRATELPRAAWLSIDTRSYRDRGWRPLAEDDQPVGSDGSAAFMLIAGRGYRSQKVDHPSGAQGYVVDVRRAA